jgi:hypothetical protein
MKGGPSTEVRSRKSHRDGVDERREGVASARAGWRGGVLVERRILRTRSRWPRASDRNWGGLWRKILVVWPKGIQGIGRHRW